MASDSTIKTCMTNAGLSIIKQSQLGAEIIFTKVKIGDGELESQDPKELTDLVNPLQELSIYNKEDIDIQTIVITAIVAPAKTGYYFREIGLFAIDPETKQEVLYAYGNKGDKASYITPNTSKILMEDEAKIIVSVANSDNITIVLDKNISNLKLRFYNVFCINSGIVGSDGLPAFLKLEENTLKTVGSFDLTTAQGKTYTITDELTKDVSELSDGDYNIFINPETQEISLKNNKIHIDNKFPIEAEIGDYLLNIAKPPYDLEEKTASENLTRLKEVYAGSLTVSGEKYK